ncbi:hypothetical protein E4A41_01090, partial [Micrococcus endophyticus]
RPRCANARVDGRLPGRSRSWPRAGRLLLRTGRRGRPGTRCPPGPWPPRRRRRAAGRSPPGRRTPRGCRGRGARVPSAAGRGRPAAIPARRGLRG